MVETHSGLLLTLFAFLLFLVFSISSLLQLFLRWFIFLGFQVIPGLLSKWDNGSGKPADLFAYVTVEDVSDPGDKPNPLRGQIRKCNLTTSKLAGVIVKEVGVLKFVVVFFSMCYVLTHFSYYL